MRTSLALRFLGFLNVVLLGLHALPVLGWGSPALACKTQPGAAVPHLSLPLLADPAGAPGSLFGTARANVVVFLRPDQPHSQTFARKLAEHLEPEMAVKSVQFTGIVSDRYPIDVSRAFVAESRLQMPVLIDTGDTAVGTLGVFLQPTVVIINERGLMAVCEHFTEINFLDVVRGEIRYLLGEISAGELQDIRHPAEQERNEAREKALTRLSLARMLFKRGKLDQALQEIQKSQAYDDTIASAYSLAGRIHAMQGDCARAAQEFEIALRLDPNDPDALAGAPECPRAFW